MKKKISGLGDLFSDVEEISPPDKKISVTFAEYKRTESVEPEDLFKGFNELRAVTFSAGINQVEHFMKFFERGEVIIGSPQQITADFAEMIALQESAVDYVSENSFLQKMIAEKKFKFYVTCRVHAKIYLMKSNDGRCRVILSSANFSANAWQMRQKENFVVMDEPEAYEYYLNVFEELRKNSSDEIGIDARTLKEDGTNLEDLPATKEAAHSKTAVVVYEQPPDSKEETEYLFAQRKTAEKFREVLKAAGVHPNEEGKILLTADKIIRMKKIMRNAHEENLARKKNKTVVMPELLLDFEKRRVTFNDELWDLEPPAEEIRNDIKNLIDYINRAEIFPGDVIQLKAIYWKVILYMFASPFFARLRYFYKDIVPANSTGKVFPMYMILRGGTHGGKSLIVETTQRLMFNRTLPLIPANRFSTKYFPDYKLGVKGCPMLIDDITNANLKYMKDIVKDDYILINEKILDHGTFIFTSNDAEQVKPEVSKRVVVFTINNRLNADVANRQDASIKKLRDEMHNALYRAYLKKIFPAVEELINEMIRGGRENWLPDIFKISSETLTEIFREHGFEVPCELKIFSWTDFLGEEIKSKQAVGTIENLFEFSPQIFSVNEGKDRLTIDLSSLDQKTQQKVSDILEAELPPSTERIRVGNIVTMKLSEIKKFARLPLSDDKNFLQKIFSLFSRK